jgi:hypothetical protein
MGKAPRHKGILKKKISLVVPPVKPSLIAAFEDDDARRKRRLDEIKTWLQSEGLPKVKTERGRKLISLLDYYNLLPPEWSASKAETLGQAELMYRLAMALAIDYVPGFEVGIKEEKRAGAPTEWTPGRLTALAWDVERAQESNPDMTTKQVCKALAKRPRRQHEPHGWQHYDAETLRRRYTEAKNGPVLIMLRHLETMIREQGKDPNIELEKSISSDRPD